MEKQEIENYKKAGEIAQKVIVYAKEIIKPEVKLLDIAEKIEGKIKELVLVATLLLSTTAYSQADSTHSNNFYIGINTGFSMVIVENSGYLWRLGGTLFYNFVNNFLNFTYNRLIIFEMNFGNEPSRWECKV